MVLSGALALVVGCAATTPAVAPAPAEPAVAQAEAPRRAPARETVAPQAFVRLETVADRSRRRASRARRRDRASSMRALLVEDLRAASSITLASDRARSLRLPRFTVDASIERMDRRVRGRTVEISCQLRVAVTDQRGKMLFFLTNGAAVRVARKGFRRAFELPLQRDALEGAVRGINAKLIARIEAETRARTAARLAGQLVASE